MSWVRSLRILTERPAVATFTEALALVRSEAGAADHHRLALAEMTAQALDQLITTTKSGRST
ncbi:hypothetical protein [Belnapia sp. F-4-1]|uniref:hypothetical protein n=1 Tax=Belnapia sp. F-4-1 TaxID=1545443 RepID=UPI0005BE93E3|nr:hypothetical protein [Belnapia sp. F-4-1]